MTDLNDRQAQIEAVAIRLWDIEREGTDLPAWDDIKAEHYGIGWKGQDYYRKKAAAALDAIEPWGMDALLDGVGQETEIEHLIQVWGPGVPLGWGCEISIPGRMDRYRAIGPTRELALRNAVAAARKETGNERDNPRRSDQTGRE